MMCPEPKAWRSVCPLGWSGPSSPARLCSGCRSTWGVAGPSAFELSVLSLECPVCRSVGCTRGVRNPPAESSSCLLVACCVNRAPGVRSRGTPESALTQSRGVRLGWGSARRQREDGEVKRLSQVLSAAPVGTACG